MKQIPKKGFGLGLTSGGLDSILSAQILLQQGVAVEWISFETPFFSAHKARKAASLLKIPIHVENITDIYLPLLRQPPRGYGKNMNPCMDCHTLMFKIAGSKMAEGGFDFLFSGEVLGQRPMSQNREALGYVAKNSGFEGLILRPLSAKNLPETLPEKSGLVDRSRLLGLSGRSRKPQMQLARDFGISDYPSPAGGCLLTEIVYSKRLRDLFDHQKTTPERDLHLLKHGRHFRLGPSTKCVVGRTQKDNAAINEYIEPEQDTVLTLADIPGPTALIPGGGEAALLPVAAAICAGYSKAPSGKPARVRILSPDGPDTLLVAPLPPTDAKTYLI